MLSCLSWDICPLLPLNMMLLVLRPLDSDGDIYHWLPWFPNLLVSPLWLSEVHRVSRTYKNVNESVYTHNVRVNTK